jgi:formylmethanofuran dehydrogenase subunit B
MLWDEVKMTAITDVVCPVCGCCCDDIELAVRNNSIVDVKNVCAVGEAKFLGFSDHRCLTPLIRKNGELVEASFDAAVRKSAEILANASYPVLYGWSSTGCEAIRKGLELAEEVGGVIDNSSSVCHGPSILGIQDVGISSSTLGQLRHRADLVIYWGSNPMSSHPRHIERYTAFSEGRFQPSAWRGYLKRLNAVLTKKRLRRLVNLIQGRDGIKVPPELGRQLPYTLFKEGRKMIVVDVRRTHSADLADYFIQVQANQDYELIQALRMLIRDEEVEVDEVAGVPIGVLEEIAEVLISCDLGILFFGLGLTMSEGKHRNIDAALSLVRDLNRRTKFLIMPMRGHFNVTGANTVFTWQTGYPFAVDFSHGYPRYNPGETSVIDVLCRGETDASLVVASDPVSHFPRKAVEHLVRKPLIVIDPEFTPTSLMANVVFPAAYVGIEAEGTTYRMDHVPLPLKRVVTPPKNCLPDVEILERILREVRRIRRGEA